MIVGNPAKWNDVVPHIYSKDKPVVNILFALHVLIAGMVSLMGPLQFIPIIRKQTPQLHRIIGRIYVISAFLIGLDGLFLIWRKGSDKDLFQSTVISFNALVIIACAWLVINNARKRNIAAHNRWAIHLLLAMSGVWFFRVFLMLWLMVNNGPVGIDPDTFSGPALNILSVAVYIMPQGIALLYFKTKNSTISLHKQLFAYTLFLITMAMSVGLLAAALGLWLPRFI